MSRYDDLPVDPAPVEAGSSGSNTRHGQASRNGVNYSALPCKSGRHLDAETQTTVSLSL